MSEINHGGAPVGDLGDNPAFPSLQRKYLYDDAKGNAAYYTTMTPGMDLRAWLAGRAMTSLLTCSNLHFLRSATKTDDDELAKRSREIADAMIRALEVKP